MKMSERTISCFRCMRLPVSEIGEICQMCQEGWDSPYRTNPTKQKPLERWTLQELIDTQDSGDVPGQAMYERHEVPVADIEGC